MKKGIIIVIVLIIGAIGIGEFLRDEEKLSTKYVFEGPIIIEDFISAEGLIMQIRTNTAKDKWKYVEIYQDGTFKFYQQKENSINLRLEYELAKEGQYQYDIKKILKEMKLVNRKEYEITLGNNDKYYTDSRNQALKEFLEEINVNL